MIAESREIMIRNIIEIDEEKCNGCGLCAEACHENAIRMIDGKAKLIRDDYCDGLGNCLPVCPVDAITMIEREAAAFDEEAVMQQIQTPDPAPMTASGCPGRQVKTIRPVHAAAPTSESQPAHASTSELSQWPVQIKLAPVNAAFFNNARLLIAADCTAYSYANFHQDFIRNHVTLIGCPKLDEGDYSEKLTEILKNNTIKSVKIVRMEVPCCKGLEMAVSQALKNSGKMIPWQVVVISTDGDIIED